MDSIETKAPSLAETLSMLRRRWLAILAPAIIVIGVALVYAQVSASNLEPTFDATQRIAVNPERELNKATLEQFAILINEGEVGDVAAAGLPEGVAAKVRATALTDIGVIEVTAEADVPQDAVTAAAAYGDELITFTNSADVVAYTGQLSTVQAEFVEASDELDKLQFSLFNNPLDLRLQADRDTALARYSSALDTVRAVEVQGIPEPQLRTLAAGRAAEVPPAGFVGMPLARQIAIAIVFGLIVGLAVAYLLEAIDRRLKGPSSTSEAFGMPILAEVPYAGKAFEKGHEIAPMGSMIMEAYRRLRTIIQLERDTSERASAGASVILVVSGSPSEGKTVTASHLAVALGETGSKVLLISADFRRPALHKYFGADPGGGIEALASSTPQDDQELVKSTDHRGVRLVTAGKGHPEPTQLIHHAKRVVAEAREICDYIVIDTSPLLSANDALDFVNQSDVVVVVSRFRQTTTPAAHRVRDMLFQIGAPVLGVISTGVRKSDGYGYYYGADYKPSGAPVDADRPWLSSS